MHNQFLGWKSPQFNTVESIYLGVVSLRNLKLVIFLGKHNNLELWGADIGNAYLEVPQRKSYTL